MENLIYRNFLENSKEPMWIVDLEFKYIYVNETYKKCYSLNREIIGVKLVDIVPTEISDRYMQNFKVILNEKKVVTIECDLNGKHYKVKTFPILNNNGEVQAIGGLVIDITERDKREKVSLYNHNLLQNVIDAIPEMIFLKDLYGRYQFVNKACRSFHSNLGVDEVIGKMDIEINPNKNASYKSMAIDNKIVKDKKSMTTELILKDYNNRVYVNESLKSPLINECGEVVGIVGISRDITEKKKLEEELRYLSCTDALTGIYNRAGFESKIDELKKSNEIPIGLIMGDVNGLKLINDTFGHIEGDKLLVSIANVLKAVCGNYGYVFRWGGDEFVVLIPNAGDQICELIIKNIKKECIANSSGLIELSMSMGWSIFKTPNDDIDEVLRDAEEKVYKQKIMEQKNILSGAITLLQESLEEKSLETREHTQRMIKLVIKLGERMRLSVSQLEELEIATRLHDIGKIGITEEILLKPGKLTDEEYQIIKTHTEKGYRIVMASRGLEGVAKTVLTHHERWDGNGYPLGLKRNEIPLASRIISIVDAYDAMTNDRVYRKSMTKEDAIEEIKKSRGTQFDPIISILFLEMITLEEIDNTSCYQLVM